VVDVFNFATLSPHPPIDPPEEPGDQEPPGEG